MRKLLIAAALVATSIPAMAQSPVRRICQHACGEQPNSPPNPGAPVAGANSFTEGQAKSRIEARGFTNVTGSRKTALASGAAQPPKPASPSK